MANYHKAPQKLILTIIKGYQSWISPVLGNNCRFQPSCSQYANEAITRFGILKGGWLSGKRILKCHPLNAGGIDPVPTSNQEK
jgi:uncharacterized protein